LETTAGDTRLYYAVLPDGLQPISAVLASVLRNANSYGLDQPPRLGADDVARLPVSRTLDTAGYPDQPLSLVDTAADPVTCAHWSRPLGASTSSWELLSGSVLPVPEGLRSVDLVGAGADGTATRVALTPGSGYFTQTVGQANPSPRTRAAVSPSGAAAPPPAAGSLFWVSDTGVRYGIDETSDGSGRSKTVEALGLAPPPVPIPWSVLSLFASGPTLSRADALLAHDGLVPDQRPSRRVSTDPGAAATSGRETR
jgi:type VII secretion protein EccB